jgi:dihydroorotase
MLETSVRVLLLLIFGLTVPAQSQESFDIVLANGRVMDPETGLDGMRSVGIRGDRIVAISEGALSGDVVLDVAGLVIAPGFIDLHAHGQSYQSNEYQAHDGVTTALELESGVVHVADWLEARKGKRLLNFGATVSHGSSRHFVMPGLEDALARRRALVRSGDGAGPGDFEELRRAGYEELTPEQIKGVADALDEGLNEGALGVGMAHGYYPGATNEEIFRIFQFAASREAPIFTHVRNMGVEPMQEVIANAASTGAPLHIVHANSMSLWNIGVVLDLIEGARRQGIDITTEAYPYTAASTNVASTIFDPGWRERLRISYEDLQLQETGERLTAATFDKYRTEGAIVIIHMMKPDWIEHAMKTPFVMIASDGMPYAPGAHPRSAGTFSRVLGRYVREQKVMSLMDALGKMTLMPAKRLQEVAPQMRNKGRLQIGKDADITVFNPNLIIDTATFEDDLSFSKGVEHVLVNGQFVVRSGKTVDVRPGKAILGEYRESR